MKTFLKSLAASVLGTFIALAACMLLLIGIIGSLAMIGSDSQEPVIPESAILKIDMSKPIAERGNDDPFSGISALSFQPASKSISVLDAVTAIDKASTDPSIKFIYLTVSEVNTGMTQLEEIRNALVKFRTSGKPVIAYANNYSQGAYYLASVADKIYIQQEGSAQILGIGTNMMFFKDLLDRLGIEVQLIRHGKFKAAAEQFISNNISQANREQNEELIESIWNTWTKAICQSREISEEDFNKLVNNLEIGNAQSLLENKLADEAVTYNGIGQKLCALFNVEKEKDLKMVSLAQYAKAKVKNNMKSKDKIAILYANGEITMNGSDGITAYKFCPAIQKIREDSTIKALVLRVNSPGGDAQAAEMINSELQLLRETKPIIVSFGDYAASGGYWISVKSDCIFTNNTTLTGSIGVFSLMFNYGKGLKKHLDINSVSLGTNNHSDMFMGVRPLDNEEQKYMQNFVEDIYVKFTDLVATGRDLTTSYVDSIGQGRVWSGADALAIKLADKEGGIYDALQYAATFAGLENYRIVEYPAAKNSMDKFLEKLNEASVSAEILANPYNAFERIYGDLASYNGTKTYARLPYIYEFSY
ncbi:MAG: signal peptide peptidase SppA [Bacteroidales bacterium]|nr:signal peptide peptidase SppA [Bacteroidales bacterium]